MPWTSKSLSVQATGDTTIFGTDEASAAAKARHLLNAAAGAARMELVNEARWLVHGVLPVGQLPPSHSAASPQRSQPQTPIQVCDSLLSTTATHEHNLECVFCICWA